MYATYKVLKFYREDVREDAACDFFAKQNKKGEIGELNLRR